MEVGFSGANPLQASLVPAFRLQRKELACILSSANSCHCSEATKCSPLRCPGSSAHGIPQTEHGTRTASPAQADVWGMADLQWEAVGSTGHYTGRRVQHGPKPFLLLGGSPAACRGAVQRRVWLLLAPLLLSGLGWASSRLPPSLLSLAEHRVTTHRPRGASPCHAPYSSLPWVKADGDGPAQALKSCRTSVEPAHEELSPALGRGALSAGLGDNTLEPLDSCPGRGQAGRGVAGIHEGS